MSENEFLEIAKEDDIYEICQLLKIVSEDLHNRGIKQWMNEMENT